MIGISYDSYRATRVAYYLATNEDPGEYLIIHSCDNPNCCNPRHLSKGTTLDNIEDRVKKKRSANGESSGLTDLVLADVEEIRRLDREGVRQGLIAEKFGVTSACISNIVNGRTWIESFDSATARTGRMKGELHPMSVMTSEKVRSMRELSETGLSRAELARRFKVSGALCSLIVRRKIWKHVL
jgi:transcriptional regulator